MPVIAPYPSVLKNNFGVTGILKKGRIAKTVVHVRELMRDYVDSSRGFIL